VPEAKPLGLEDVVDLPLVKFPARIDLGRQRRAFIEREIRGALDVGEDFAERALRADRVGDGGLAHRAFAARDFLPGFLVERDH